MKFRELLAVMKLYESNFRNLHWNTKGIEFNDTHKGITEEYYEMYADNIDKVAEMMAMLGINPPTFFESADIIQNSESEYVTVDSNTLYNREAIVNIANDMLMSTCGLLAEVLKEECFEDMINAGIKSEFETILYTFTLQARYINARKLVD